ncbi:MAG: TIGR03618 family F420-dependent PPOX class oxidoreductase [Myxococcota bacterium]|nr:TIGR03618 family F420-dependent PPOX class oxidoreductase [Myxococcota bacterium]
MPKLRDRIRMTDEDAWRFIASRKAMQTATLNRDGSPHLTTNWFALVDGQILFETYSKSQKVVNLRRDPRIALLWEDGDLYTELRGVSLNGTATLIDDFEAVADLAQHVVRRNYPETSEADVAEAGRNLARKRTGVVVRPEKLFSWDHRKLT